MNAPKYPRTFHLPFSPGATRDDRMADDVSALVGCDVVVTEKLDGSNVCLTAGGLFARSHAGPPDHPSFDPLKARHAALRHLLSSAFPTLALYGEWCYAVHSIVYPTLPSSGWLQLFAAFDMAERAWLGFDDLAGVAATVGVPTVPLLWSGRFSSAQELKEVVTALAAEPSRFGPEREGVVVRRAAGFTQGEWSRAVAKWVRANHVRTSTHWRHGPVRRHDEVTG